MPLANPHLGHEMFIVNRENGDWYQLKINYNVDGLSFHDMISIMKFHSKEFNVTDTNTSG